MTDVGQKISPVFTVPRGSRIDLTNGFLPRDAMHSADYAIARCLSVRPSVTRRYSVETAKHIMKLFLLSSSHTVLVTAQQTVWQYSDGDPPDGGVECKGYEIIVILVTRNVTVLKHFLSFLN